MTSSTSGTKSCLLTVGSTEFNPLVSSFLSLPVLTTLSTLGYSRISAQIGTSLLPSEVLIGSQTLRLGKNSVIELDVFRFENELERIVSERDLVISHAGAGSILSFIHPTSSIAPSNTSALSSSLSSSSRKLIIVPNDSLMDSHQTDLANEFEHKNWALVLRDPSHLNDILLKLGKDSVEDAKGMEKIPKFEPARITKVLDQVLGYV